MCWHLCPDLNFEDLHEENQTRYQSQRQWLSKAVQVVDLHLWNLVGQVCAIQVMFLVKGFMHGCWSQM